MISITDALRTFSASEQVSYILDASLNLTCCNKTWDKFARENFAPELADGAAIGTNLLSVTDKSLRSFYREAFRKVARENTVWEWEYECSSPKYFRKFLMRIHPITPAGWFLVTNCLLVEAQHARRKRGCQDYVNAHGKIHLCVHCRCSKRVGPSERWDFVPANLRQENARVTPDLCPICKAYFYPSRLYRTGT